MYTPSPRIVLTSVFFLTAFLLLPLDRATAQDPADCDKFVTASGKGRTASLEKPAKDLGNIITKLEPGDVVCIAGGVYTGRGARGADKITVPVSIIGGWDDTFTSRDPFGATATILTGEHNSKNFETGYRLTINTKDHATRLMEARNERTKHSIIVNGLIIDNGPRNYYRGNGDAIVRKGSASHTPTPESGGLNIASGVNATIDVRNVLVMNTAPTQGAFAIFPGWKAKVTIEGNAAINNTGTGFLLSASSKSSEKSAQPRYTFRNNISIFNEKFDAYSTFGGSSVALESEVRYDEISNNVFAFNDNYGIDNSKRGKELVITNNVIAHNAVADYMEFDTRIDLDDIEDEAEYIDDGEGNSQPDVNVNISAEWLGKYLSRTIIDRNAAEEDVRLVDSWSNDVRRILGANMAGTGVSADSDVWLPRMQIADALAALAGLQALLN